MFHAKMREAEATQAQAQAYKALAEAFGGPQGLLQYMMLKENTYEKLALANAKAIQGLQPKITVWNTGGDGEGAGGMGQGIAPIKNIMQSLPPLLSTVQEQTGIALPAWMLQMPPKDTPQTNGHLESPDKKKMLKQ